MITRISCKRQEVEVEHKAFVRRLPSLSGEQLIPHPVGNPDIIHLCLLCGTWNQTRG